MKSCRDFPQLKSFKFIHYTQCLHYAFCFLPQSASCMQSMKLNISKRRQIQICWIHILLSVFNNWKNHSCTPSPLCLNYSLTVFYLTLTSSPVYLYLTSNHYRFLTLTSGATTNLKWWVCKVYVNFLQVAPRNSQHLGDVRLVKKNLKLLQK